MTESLSKCSPTSYTVKKVDKVAALFKSSKNAENEKNDVKTMNIGFWVEQCLHALFECQEDVDEISKNHT